MKKLICFALALVFCVTAFASCGKFDMEKEDLSAYVKLGDLTDFPYAEVEKRYNEYRAYLGEAMTSFYPVAGYTLDLSVKAELVGEGGALTAVTKWSNDDLKGYDVYKTAENSVFDYGICNAVSDTAESAKVGRLVKLGEAFSFTTKVSESNEDKTLAGKTVKFTVTAKKVLPDVYTESYLSPMLMAFYAYASKVTVGADDNVIVSFTGEVDGNLFVRETSASVTTNAKAVYGFEAQLAGHREDETVKLTATIPADYKDAALAGKTATYEVTIKKVYKGIKTGDSVKLNYVGTVDGERFTGSTGENFSVVIGDGTLFFEEKLLGHKEEKFEIAVTLPADFEDETVAGKEAKYAIEIKDVYNDTDIIRNNTPFENMWELKNALRVKAFATEGIIGILLDRSELIAYPEKLLSAFRKIYTDYVNTQIAESIKAAKLEGKKYTKQQMKDELFPDGNVDEYIEETAKEMTFRYLVVKMAQKALDIPYTEKDYQVALEKMADEYTSYYGTKFTPSDIEKMTGEEELRLNFLSVPVSEKLAERVTGAPVIPMATK